MNRTHTVRRPALLAGVFALLVMAGLPGLALAAEPAAPPPPVAAAATLTPEQEAGLAYMREEEKLAHDVYLAFSAEWGLPAFERIASAEQRHTSSVLRLLNLYGLPDQASTLPAGQFANAELQELYDTLVAQGAASLDAALEAGALIEEVDIADLDEQLAGTLPPAVANVYSHLRSGSANHLRAFTRLLAAQGIVYEPQVLDAGSYAAITASGSGRMRP